MRALWLVTLLVPLAGCLSDAPAAASQEPVAEGPERQEASVEGRYSALKPLGQALREEGGRATLEVAGWHGVLVTFDANIEVDLFLLPPGCGAPQDACALQYAPEDDETGARWVVPAMQAGTWTVAVQAAAADYTYVDGAYQVDFAYYLD